MKAKTYGIHGLSEWYGTLKAGSIAVTVSFKGGTASPSGAQPAYFMTKDPITQFVIENSKQFKQGFITLERSQELPGSHPRLAKAKPGGSHAAEGGTDEGAAAEGGTDEGGTDEGAAAEGGSIDDNGVEDAEGGQPREVEVPSLDDAKEWLVENCGEKASNLRSKAAILAAAQKHGVAFTGI